MASELSPQRAALLGRLGAYALHARGLTNTAPARAAFAAKFVTQARQDAADRGEAIDDAEAERRAEYLRRAHFARLALRSADARRRRSSRRGRTGSDTVTRAAAPSEAGSTTHRLNDDSDRATFGTIGFDKALSDAIDRVSAERDAANDRGDHEMVAGLNTQLGELEERIPLADPNAAP